MKKQSKPYLVHFFHFATGEGMTEIVAHVIDISPEQAIRTALTRHLTGPNVKLDEEGLSYFSRGAQVVDLSDESTRDKAKQWLGKFLKPDVVEYLINAERQNALFEFVYKHYVNFF